MSMSNMLGSIIGLLERQKEEISSLTLATPGKEKDAAVSAINERTKTQIAESFSRTFQSAGLPRRMWTRPSLWWTRL